MQYIRSATAKAGGIASLPLSKYNSIMRLAFEHTRRYYLINVIISNVYKVNFLNIEYRNSNVC